MIECEFEAFKEYVYEFFIFAPVALVELDIGVVGERVEHNAYQSILLFWFESFFADKAGESIDEREPLFCVLKLLRTQVSGHLEQLTDECILNMHWNQLVIRFLIAVQGLP